jgi:hypothetical protein
LAKTKPKERKRLSNKVTTAVLTEAGYRCAVPTCRGILAIDMHHIWEVNAGGGNAPSNLIALCPTCHALYHRGTIKEESIYAYKAMLVSLSNAFDLEAIDKLLFLEMCPEDYLIVSGDGVLTFARLIAAGLASVKLMANNANQIVTYSINLSEKGTNLITAWKSGKRTQLMDLFEGETGDEVEEQGNGQQAHEPDN